MRAWRVQLHLSGHILTFSGGGSMTLTNIPAGRIVVRRPLAAGFSCRFRTPLTISTATALATFFGATTVGF